MRATTLAKTEGWVRPILTKIFNPKKVVSMYSNGRLDFMEKLKKDVSETNYVPSEKLSRVLWGIKFRSPIMNSAGMFKNGECYKVVEKQGAGAYLGGTGTWNPRIGNEKEMIFLPFTPYPRSHSSSNWLGLPNDGDEINSKRVKELGKTGMPVGWSIMGSPDYQGEEKLRHLIEGMNAYEKAGVDFLEINESCPNTSHGKPQDDDLANRLKYVKRNFLDKRKRKIPVIVKFSSDTELEQVPELVNLIVKLGFDGINFGNTSTQYEKRKMMISPYEKELYDFFTKTFGGGISGRPLKASSLQLASLAVQQLKKIKAKQEFHIIRTGGIETIEDIKKSDKAGISMNQWFTGYFENFAKHGHGVYKKLFE